VTLEISHDWIGEGGTMNLRQVMIVVLSASFCISFVRAASPPPPNPPQAQLTIPAEELLRRFEALEKEVARLGAEVATLEQQLVSSTCDAGQFPLCCPVGDTFCPATGCVDLNSDSFNCGACGNTCDAPLSCVLGVCALACAASADCPPRGDTCWPDTGTCGCGSGGLCDRLSDCEGGQCTPNSCVGLNGYWRLDEGLGLTTADTIDGHPGMLVNDPMWTTGKLGNALAFGGGSHVVIPDAADLDPHLGDFSVEAWIKIPPSEVGQRRIVAHGAHGAPGFDGFSLMQWCMGEPCGITALVMCVDENGCWLVGTCQPMDDGTWHHYVGMVDRGGFMSLWVDGARLEAPCTWEAYADGWTNGQPGNISHLAGTDIDSPCNLCLGVSCQYIGSCLQQAEFDEPFKGRLDEVAYYGRLLTPEEIADHYAAGAGKHVCEPF